VVRGKRPLAGLRASQRWRGKGPRVGVHVQIERKGKKDEVMSWRARKKKRFSRISGREKIRRSGDVSGDMIQ